MGLSAGKMTIDRAIELCVEDLRNQRAPLTARNYANGLRVFKIYLAECDPPLPSPKSMLSKLNIDHFVGFPAWLSGDGKYAKATVQLYIWGSRALLDWMVLNRYIKLDYADTLRYERAIEGVYRKREKKKPNMPDEGNAEKVLAAVYDMKLPELQRLRNIALVLFLYSSGARAFEAATLVVGEVDLENCKANIIGKGTGGNRSDIVYFSHECAEALDAYWHARKNTNRNSPAFARHDKGAGKIGTKPLKAITTRTVVNVVDTAAAIAGIEANQFHPHSFRHAFVKRVLHKSNGNLTLAQDLARHKSPVTTRIYSETAEQELQREHHRIFDE